MTYESNRKYIQRGSTQGEFARRCFLRVNLCRGCHAEGGHQPYAIGFKWKSGNEGNTGGDWRLDLEVMVRDEQSRSHRIGEFTRIHPHFKVRTANKCRLVTRHGLMSGNNTKKTR